MVNRAWMRGKGEGKMHISMNSFVKGIMLQMKYNPVAERFAIHHQDSNSENEWLRRPQGVYHEFDLCGFTVTKGLNEEVQKFKLFVEIDGEWHDNQLQKNKDETAQIMLEEYYKAHPDKGKYALIRLKKDDVKAAMSSGDHDSLCLKLFVNLPGSPITFLPHMVKELQEENAREDDIADVNDGQPDEAKEWEDFEGVEQDMYPE
jgi:hypothetical protein